MRQTLIEYANSLTPNLPNDRCELWLKTGHYKYLRAVYLVGQAESAQIQPLKSKMGEVKVSPSTIDTERLEEYFDTPISWQDLYDRTGQIEGGLFYYPQMPSGLPLGDYAVSAGDLITIESDHATIEEQQEVLQKFEQTTKLKFFSKIFSGKKSIHANIGLDDRMNWEDGDYLSKLCFLAFLSDPSLGSHAAIARYPGGMRKSKDGSKEQELLEHSQSRYSYEMVKAAIQSFYLIQHGVPAPTTIPPLWWGEIRKKLLEPSKHGDPKEMIVKGVEAWQKERDTEQKTIDAQRAKLSKEYSADPRSEKSFRGRAWAAIVEARKAAPSPLLKDGHSTSDRQSDTGSRTIGFCPIHGGSSGSSARVRQRNGEYRFACWTCTYDGKTRADVDMLEYAYLESGGNFHKLPRGRDADDWLILPQLENFARDFCRRNGVTMPDRQPIDKSVKKKLKAVEPPVGQPKVVQQEDPKPAPPANKVVEHKEKSKKRWAASLVRKELQAIVDQGLTSSEQEEEFIELCDRSGYAQNEIFKLFQSVKQGDEEVDLNDRFSELNGEKEDFLLPVAWYSELCGIYESTGISLSAVQAPILSVVSSLISRTRLCLKPSTGWWVKPQIWSATIGRPGTKKSFTVDIAGDPLVKIDKENMEKYWAAVARWKQDKKINDKAEAPPFVSRHCMQEFTIEALEKQLVINNGTGICILTDEMKAWFGSMGRYSKNGGSLEAARWCQFYEGRTYDRTRASDLEEEGDGQGQYIKDPIVALCGAIQPDVVIDRMRSTQKDGLIDRIAWTKAPPSMDQIEYDDPELEDYFFREGHRPKYPLFDRLENLYRILISDNTGLNLRLGSDAREVYKAFFDKMAYMGNRESIPALQPLYAKHQIHAAKFAIASHMIKRAAGEVDSLNLLIDRDTMEASVALAEHSLVIALELWLESQDSLNCEVIARKICDHYPGQTVSWTKVRSLGRSSGARNGQAFKKEEVIKIFNYMALKGYGTHNKDEFTVK